MSKSSCSDCVTAGNSDCKNGDCWQLAPVTTRQWPITSASSLQWWRMSRRLDSRRRGPSPRRSTRPGRVWSGKWWTQRQDAPGRAEPQGSVWLNWVIANTAGHKLTKLFRICTLSVMLMSVWTLIWRLVRGEGEIIEEIVSREKHKDINRVKGKTLNRIKTLCFLQSWLWTSLSSNSRPPGATEMPSRGIWVSTDRRCRGLPQQAQWYK